MISYRRPGIIFLINDADYALLGDDYILSDISLELTPGEHLAVVGLNGAGKTTLVKLITGLLEPTQGRVLYDGVDIQKFNRNQYYKIFAAVFQDYSLMPVTIKEIVAESKIQDGQTNQEKAFRIARTIGNHRLPYNYNHRLREFLYTWDGQCDANSKAYVVILRYLEMEAEFTASSAVNHAICIVKMGELWYPCRRYT